MFYSFTAAIINLWILPLTQPSFSTISCAAQSPSKLFSTENSGNSHGITRANLAAFNSFHHLVFLPVSFSRFVQPKLFPFAFVVLSDHYLARGLTLELAAVKHIDCDRADIISSNAVGDLIVLDVEREFTAV